MRAFGAWLRTPRAMVLGACALVVGLRAPFVHVLPFTDEGGLLVVARQWHTGGPFLYGSLFVDRPPLLLLFFRACAALGGIVAVRVLALGLVVVAVAAAARAGSVLAGRRGAVTAAVVAAAFLADPVLGTREVNAETVGLPLTLASAACLLEAMHRPAARRWLLVSGGVLSACSLLVKQNLADGLAFGVVLVIASAWTAGRRRVAADLGWLGLGVAVPLAVTALWAAVAGPGLGELIYTLYGFRFEGSQALLATPTASQGERLRELCTASLESGLVPLLPASIVLARRRLLHDPAGPALLAMVLVALVGVAGGGYYWTHYLLGLVPVAALLAAPAAGGPARARLLTVLVAAVVVSTLVGTTNAWLQRPSPADTWVGATTSWAEATRQPGDSAVVLYGEAALFETTGLRPAYPYLWTLPMRVLDPRLVRLRALLAGSAAPTFVFVRSPINAWGIDPRGRLRHTVERHYRRVAVVCGSAVYVRLGVDRTIAPAPAGCR